MKKTLIALSLATIAVAASAQTFWRVDCAVGPQFIGSFQVGIYPTFASACQAQATGRPSTTWQVVNDQHCVLLGVDFIVYAPIQDVCRADPHFRAGPIRK